MTNSIVNAGTITGSGNVMGSPVGAPTFSNSVLMDQADLVFTNSSISEFLFTNGEVPGAIRFWLPPSGTTLFTVNGIASGPYMVLNGTTFTVSNFDPNGSVLQSDGNGSFDTTAASVSFYNATYNIQTQAPGFTLNWN
jgi:hypothetical protein